MRMKRELEADEKVMAKVRAEGDRLAGSFDYVSKTTGNVNKGLQLTNERAVMMGQVVGGLTAQMISGADGTQLMATGLTHMAMILSTAGPWGMAAGAAVTTVTSLVTALINANKEAKKTAEDGYKELEKIISATNDEIRKIDSEEHARALEKHKRAIDDIGESWQKSLESSRKYYREQDARADAELGLKLSELDLEKEERLSQVTDPIEREAVEEEFRTKERDAQFEADKAKIDRRQKQLEEEKKRAELTQQEAAAQIKQLENEIPELERELASDRPKGVKSDQQVAVDRYEEALRDAMEKAKAEGAEFDEYEKRRLGKLAEEARLKAEELRPAATKGRELIDAGRETYERVKDSEEVQDYNQRREQGEATMAQLREQLAAQKNVRNEAYVASKDVDAQLGNLGLERDTLINRSLREDKLAERRADAINERRRAYEESLTPEDRNTKELNRRLNGVTDPQKRSEIELGFQKELETKAKLDVQRNSLAGALKGAEGRDKAGDRDLRENLGKLADAAVKSAEVDDQTKADLQKAVKALEGGADDKELAEVARLLQKTAEVNEKNMKILVQATEVSLDRAKSLEARMQQLAKRLNELK
jgi:hypothetical protein